VDEGPEGSVVEVVDVAVDLTPREIVLDQLLSGVTDAPAVKARRIEHRLVNKDLWPGKHVRRCEGRNKGRDDL